MKLRYGPRLLLVYTFLLTTLPIHDGGCFHFPWDQGHDTCLPERPPDDPEQCDKCNSRGSPFVIASGAYTTSKQDIYLRGRVRLNLVRSFHGKDRHNGMFGRGWTFNYGIRLIEVTDGINNSVLIRRGNGHRDRFNMSADGHFQSPPDVQDRLYRNPSGFELHDKDGSIAEFGTTGFLLSVKSRTGSGITLSYDTTGFLLRVADSDGRVLRFEKGPNGKIAAVIDSSGRTVQYDYDLTGNLVKVTGSAGDATQYTYDVTGNLTAIIDPRGNAITSVMYDSLGRLNRYSDQGESFTISYFPEQGRVIETDSRGLHRSLYYNQNYNATRIIDFMGTTRDFLYDASYRVAATIDPNGNTNRFTYFADGSVASITDAMGSRVSFTFDENSGRVATIRDARGHETGFRYSPNGLLLSIQDPMTNRALFNYDAQGLLAERTDPAGNKTKMAYDLAGNLTKTEDPLGNITAFAYDTLGWPIALTNADGSVRQLLYDAARRVTNIIEPSGDAISFRYDPNGNLVEFQDALTNRYLFDYDAFNRRTRASNPLGQSKSLTYDTRGRVIQSNDGKGQRISFEFDAAGRLLRKTTPDNTCTFTYDANGNMLTCSDDDSTCVFAYDAANRVLEARTEAGLVQPSTVLRYAYDLNRNKVSIVDPDGHITRYEYDSLNRPTNIAHRGQQVLALQYDSLSRQSRAQFGNGLSNLLEYDAASQLTRISYDLPGGAQKKFDYSYDALGRKVRIQTSIDTYLATYDSLSRLTNIAASSAIGTERYDYDANGNVRRSGQFTAFRYDAANRLLEDNVAVYVYDANGSRIEKRDKVTGVVTAYSYDAENQLVQVRSNQTIVATYRYDGFGRRIEKRTVTGVRKFIYDGLRIAVELDENSAVTKRYIHGLGLDTPIAYEEAGRYSYFLADGMGSVICITDDTGSDVASFSYSAFGIRSGSQPNFESSLAFIGREFDSESGLYFMRMRYYDPAAGRFLQEDPLGFNSGQLNLYSYVGNDPLNWVDPLGACQVDVRFSRLGPGYYHAYIVTTEPDGTQYYFRGGPSGAGPSSGGSGAISSGSGGSSSGSSGSGSSGSSNSSNSTSPGSGRGGPGQNNGPWGPIGTDYGRYVPGTIDWDPGSPPSMRVADQAGDCECYNKPFGQIMDDIANANIPYNPFSRNSNATVRETLERAGLNPGRPPVWAPGWNTQLP
jgi:RHS repeat-associated protein